VFAKCSADLRETCPTFKCRGFFEWKPSIGSVEAREPFFDEASGKTFTSFREMDKDAEAHGRTVMSAKEYESRRPSSRDDDRPDHSKKERREAIQKSLYRLRHGYKDHAPIEKVLP